MPVVVAVVVVVISSIVVIPCENQLIFTWWELVIYGQSKPFILYYYKVEIYLCWVKYNLPKVNHM